MKIIGRVLNSLAMLCFAFIMVVLVAAAPIAAGYRADSFSGNSMEPTLKSGSLIYIKAASFESIHRNDLIIFTAKPIITVRRVYEIDQENREFKTKSDNISGRAFNSVHYDDVIGKVNYQLPYAGILSNLYVIAGALLYLIIWFVFRAKIKNQKQKAETKSPKGIACPIEK